jgi:hypothetical protein
MSVQVLDERKDYENRNKLIYTALALAANHDLECGVRFDKDADWPIAYIELPVGQVAWNLPSFKKDFDGHTPIKRAERIKAFSGSFGLMAVT